MTSLHDWRLVPKSLVPTVCRSQELIGVSQITVCYVGKVLDRVLLLSVPVDVIYIALYFDISLDLRLELY